MAYTKITQEEAKYLMDTRDDILIIDVRNPEEFAEGHIPHAVNILPSPTGRFQSFPTKIRNFWCTADPAREAKLPPKSWTSWGIKISRISAASWTGNMK